MRTYPLSKSASVNLDSSGNGTVELGPVSVGEQWQLTTAAVKCATNTNEATCKIYMGGSIGDGTFMDGTFSGSTGDATDKVSVPLNPGQNIWAVWAGGDAGTQATLNVTGQRTLP